MSVAMMCFIVSQDVTPAIMALFDITKPTMPRAFNMSGYVLH